MTLYELGLRLVNEIPERSSGDHPFILWCHESTTMGTMPDEVPWCSSFVNRLAWWLRLPRSKKANAISWLGVGESVSDPKVGYDIVILSRGHNPALGHVGIFAGFDGDNVRVLGGNQSNNVTIQNFPKTRVLGYRRLN